MISALILSLFSIQIASTGLLINLHDNPIISRFINGKNIYIYIYIHSTITFPEYVKVVDEACFNAITKSADTFNAPFAGQITGIKLVHSDGGTTCDFRHYDQTNFGCSIGTGYLMTMMIADGYGTLYPTSTTENIDRFDTISCGDCQVGWWNLHGSNYNSDELIITDSDNPYNVTIDQVFSLQNFEGCCGSSTGDNLGTSCATVYFLYEESMYYYLHTYFKR